MVRPRLLWMKWTPSAVRAPSWKSMPPLKLSWNIGLMFGSVFSIELPRKSRKPFGPPHKSLPGMLLRLRLPMSSVSSDR